LFKQVICGNIYKTILSGMCIDMKKKLVIIIPLAICILLLFAYLNVSKKEKLFTYNNSSDITLITKVLKNGEVGYAIVYDFKSSIDGSTLSTESFKVESIIGDDIAPRTITKIYTNDVKQTSDISKIGQFVIIELDSNDTNASTIGYNEEKHQATRNDLKYCVTQNNDVQALDGANFTASHETLLNGKELTPDIDDFKKFTYKNSNNNKLDYRLFEVKAKSNEKYPLVVYLHGSGERGDDNTTSIIASMGATAFANPNQQEKNPCYVIAPQIPLANSAAGYWATDFNSNLLLDLIKDTISKYPIDTTRIYITGISDGGSGTWMMIEKNPGFFAAAIPICGESNVNYSLSTPPYYQPVSLSYVKIVKDIPLWVFHAADDPTVDVKVSREVVDAIKNAGGTSVKYTEYPSGMVKPTGHFAWGPTYQNQDLIDWVFKQSKI